jgi:hypothetical protein
MVPGKSFLILFSAIEVNSEAKLMILRDLVNPEKRRGEQSPVFTILNACLICC